MRIRRLIMAQSFFFGLVLSGIAGEMADGIESRTATNGDVFVTLHPERSIQIRTSGKDARMVSVANIEGTLLVVNVERDGATPVSVELFPTGGVRIVTQGCTSSNTVMTIDLNGDGIPERRVTRSSNGQPPTLDLLGKIIWQRSEDAEKMLPNQAPEATR